MVVTLHDMPGANGKYVAFDTRTTRFKEIVVVQIQELNPPDTKHGGREFSVATRDVEFIFTHIENGNNHYRYLRG